MRAINPTPHPTREPSRLSEIDTELCIKNAGGNRFDLILITSARSREIRRRNRESIKFEHMQSAVTAILEVQSGKIGVEYLRKV
jgi:DNA-directed RNA polymerase subunit K/omega